MQDLSEVSDAKEKNYFCKCLKMSTKAVELCETGEQEYYNKVVESNSVQMYACHAGVIKWAVPVQIGDLKGAVVSEGVITQKQLEDSDAWVDRLAEEYNVSKSILSENYDEITVMDEPQAQLSVEILQNLLQFYSYALD